MQEMSILEKMQTVYNTGPIHPWLVPSGTVFDAAVGFFFSGPILCLRNEGAINLLRIYAVFFNAFSIIREIGRAHV